ncbi:Do family serine endopeptidase [Pelagibacteraceae bacterium]|nr:Do family serine endopeptidase [Pelagibacteraceae bacterium]
MNLIKKIFFILIVSNISSLYAKSAPDSFADLAEQLMPSVVNISTTQTITTSKTNPFPFKFPPGSPFGEMFKDFENQQPTERKASALGSGFIIKESGIVITNNHVIANAEDILVRVGDKEYKAKLVGADPYMDVAVLQMETKDKFKPVKFGDSDLARVGDWAVAIGNPFGLGGTVTAGIISARNRDINLTRYDDFIQTDASINQGNSGGPLFNLKGEVIGINTAILGQSGSIGIGFAIPANAASNVIDQLIEFGETKRGWLGVRIQEVTKEIAEVEKLKKPQGALVASVGENSPADKAGVKAGDIILEFDEKKIDTMRTLPKVVANTKVGKNVQLKIWRNKKLITKKLTLGRLESSEEFKEKKTKIIKKKEEKIESLKISVRNINDQDISSRNLNKKTSGVVITNIEKNSQLINLLEVNDIILEVQKTSIKKISDLKNIVDGIFKKGEKTLLLTVINKNNRRRYIGVKIN